jgi:hypothetical protein
MNEDLELEELAERMRAAAGRLEGAPAGSAAAGLLLAELTDLVDAFKRRKASVARRLLVRDEPMSNVETEQTIEAAKLRRGDRP